MPSPYIGCLSSGEGLFLGVLQGCLCYFSLLKRQSCYLFCSCGPAFGLPKQQLEIRASVQIALCQHKHS